MPIPSRSWVHIPSMAVCRVLWGGSTPLWPPSLSLSDWPFIPPPHPPKGGLSVGPTTVWLWPAPVTPLISGYQLQQGRYPEILSCWGAGVCCAYPETLSTQAVALAVNTLIVGFLFSQRSTLKRSHRQMLGWIGVYPNCIFSPLYWMLLYW